jgi:magnesium transporter
MDEVREPALTDDDLRAAWPVLDAQERVEGLRLLPRDQAEDFFFGLPAADQAEIVPALPESERRSWMRLLPPDDAADLLQAVVAEDERARLLGLLDGATRTEVTALLAYAEDRAGGLMNTRYAHVRPDMTVDEAIAYLRKQSRERAETIYYSYVLDAGQRLLGVVSFRQFFDASGAKLVRDVMETDLVRVTEQTDQEEVGRVFAQSGLIAVPVVDDEGRMKGIVTVDDIVHIVAEEATEDIQKLGGTAALSAPYMKVGLREMVQKRVGWLSALFLGEMLTAGAIGYYEVEIERAVVLATFVPLIISSGGNSGSQASTLVIRAMALGEVGLRDWWRVIRRELGAGISLGVILGLIGLAWVVGSRAYGEHQWLVGATLALSLVGVVVLGTLAGSLLPFVLRRLGFDPASACAPFVATLVDVSGLVIYFTVASVILRGTLL